MQQIDFSNSGSTRAVKKSEDTGKGGKKGLARREASRAGKDGREWFWSPVPALFLLLFLSATPANIAASPQTM